MNKIWYHADCADGFMAATIIRSMMKWQSFTFDTTPVRYGNLPPEFSNGDNIYIVDFSYPKQTLLEIGKRANYVVVLDHHKTAMDSLFDGTEYPPNIKITFDLDRSGAVLAWNYAYPRLKAPMAVLMVEDRDLWRFTYDGTKAFSAGLRLLGCKDFDAWEQLWDNRNLFAATLSKGEAVLEYEQQVLEMQLKAVRIEDRWSYKVGVVNATTLISEIGDAICTRQVFKDQGVQFAAIYQDYGTYRKWSLRSRSDLDCSAIAKQFGGGGHPQASGFTEHFAT